VNEAVVRAALAAMDGRDRRRAAPYFDETAPR
jgi:hypothetical protein